MLENLPGVMLPLLMKESGPTLISFYKPGCPACSQLHPALEQLSRDGLSARWQAAPPTPYKIPSVRIVEINTQTDIEGYKVTRTPTLLLLHRGKVQEIPVDSLGEGLGDPRKIGVLLRQALDQKN